MQEVEPATSTASPTCYSLPAQLHHPLQIQSLGELFHNHPLSTCQTHDAPPHTASLPGREVVDLLEALREVHGPVDVVVVEGALWGVDRQQRIVHAQTISLCIRVREEAGLQHLVLAELDAWKFTHTPVIAGVNYQPKVQGLLFLLNKNI